MAPDELAAWLRAMAACDWQSMPGALLAAAEALDDARKQLVEAQDANLSLSSGAMESQLCQENIKLRADLEAAQARIQEVEKAHSEVFVLRAQVLSLGKHKDVLALDLAVALKQSKERYDQLILQAEDLNRLTINLAAARLEATQWREAFERTCDDIAAARQEIIKLRKLCAGGADALDQQTRSLNLAHELWNVYEKELAAARREKEEMRERTIRNVLQIVVDYTERKFGGEWTPKRMLNTIRALSAQPDPHKDGNKPERNVRLGLDALNPIGSDK